jgi:hypothetical protein
LERRQSRQLTLEVVHDAEGAEIEPPRHVCYAAGVSGLPSGVRNFAMLRTFFIFALCVGCMSTSSLGEFVRWSRINSEGLGIVDLNNVRNNFGGAGLGDFVQDGIINILDLNYVRNNFGPRQDWSHQIAPEHPTVADEIRFFVDIGEGSNPCDASVTYGSPSLALDSASNSIVIHLELPTGPVACTREYDPVRGLEGAFGPLAAGDWTVGLAGDTPLLEFTVIDVAAVPEPGAAEIAIVASLLCSCCGVARIRPWRVGLCQGIAATE